MITWECQNGDIMAEEKDKKKKEGVAEKSGEVVGDVAKKGANAVKGFGKGLMKGFKRKEGEKEEEEKGD